MEGEDPNKSGGDLLSDLFDLDESQPGVEKTGFLRTEKKDLGDVLGEDTTTSSDPALTDATQLDTDFLEARPPQKGFQLDEKIFDQVLSEDPLPPEKISFFDQILEASPSSSPELSEDATIEATQVLSKKEVPGQTPREDITILLEKPEDATLGQTSDLNLDRGASFDATAVESADAIDDALASFEKDIGSDGPDPQTFSARGKDESSADSNSPNDLDQPSEFSSEPRISEVSAPAEDFKDIFESKPMVAPDVDLAQKTFKRKRLFAAIKHVAVFSVILGGGGFSIFRLTSDQGLLGYVFEGGQFSRAYRPPTEAELQEFAQIFAQAYEARLSDDTKKIEDALIQVRGILEKDSRNLEAAQTIVEHISILIAWNGTGSAWAQQLDAAVQRVSAIGMKLNQTAPSLTMARAEALRLMAVGSHMQAIKSLQTFLPQIAADDVETAALAIELFLVNGEKEQLATWTKRIEGSKSRRARYVLALVNNDLQGLKALSAEGHLPSQVEVFVRADPSQIDIQAKLSESDKLLESISSFPSLWLKVSVFAGDLYARLGQNEKAREIWAAVVQKYPRAVDVWMKLALSYQEDALWSEALEAFKAIEKNQGFNLETASAYVSLLRRRGLWVDGARVVEAALKQYPKSADLHFQKGQIELRLYQEEAAKQSFLKSAEADKTFEPAWIGLSEISLRRKNWKEAEEFLRKIPESSPQYPRAVFALARIFEEKGERTKALETFLRVIDRDATYDDAYWHASRILLDFERIEDAEDLINRGLKADPKSALLKVASGRNFLFARDYEKAATVLGEVVSKNENLLEASYALIETYIEMRDFVKANEIINKLVAKEIRDHPLQFLRAKLIHREIQSGRSSGSPDMALRFLDSALKDQPSNPEYRVLAGRLTLGAQERQMALEHIQGALNVDPHYAPALALLGEYRLEGGDYEKAAEAFQEAAKHTRFRGPIYRKLAEAFKAFGRTDLAISYYEKVTASGSVSPEAYLELGKLYSDESRHFAAMRSLKKALQFNPKLAEAYYFLGFVQKEMGESRAAIQSFEAFLNLEPSATESAQVRDEVFFLKRNAQAN